MALDFIPKPEAASPQLVEAQDESELAQLLRAVLRRQAPAETRDHWDLLLDWQTLDALVRALQLHQPLADHYADDARKTRTLIAGMGNHVWTVMELEAWHVEDECIIRAGDELVAFLRGHGEDLYAALAEHEHVITARPIVFTRPEYDDVADESEASAYLRGYLIDQARSKYREHWRSVLRFHSLDDLVDALRDQAHLRINRADNWPYEPHLLADAQAYDGKRVLQLMDDGEEEKALVDYLERFSRPLASALELLVRDNRTREVSP